MKSGRRPGDLFRQSLIRPGQMKSFIIIGVTIVT